MIRLVHAELLKVRTTKTWWIFGICLFVCTALAVTFWLFLANDQINSVASGGSFQPPTSDGGSPDGAPPAGGSSQDLHRALVFAAANIYTAGQYFGLLFVMVLGTLLVTNEYYHQTATATFLTTPRRTSVIGAKLITAMIAAAVFWLFTTAISLTAGAIFFNAKGYDTQLGEWPVTRALLLNGLAYALWGVLGVGLGVLIRNQIGAVITGAASYIIGTPIVQGIVFAIGVVLHQSWILKTLVAWPAVASNVMVSTEEVYPGSPAWWVGALVLVGHAILFGAVGTAIMRHRDIA